VAVDEAHAEHASGIAAGVAVLHLARDVVCGGALREWDAAQEEAEQRDAGAPTQGGHSAPDYVKHFTMLSNRLKNPPKPVIVSV
jgi:hypothetical protein